MERWKRGMWSDESRVRDGSIRVRKQADKVTPRIMPSANCTSL